MRALRARSLLIGLRFERTTFDWPQKTWLNVVRRDSLRVAGHIVHPHERTLLYIDRPSDIAERRVPRISCLCFPTTITCGTVTCLELIDVRRSVGGGGGCCLPHIQAQVCKPRYLYDREKPTKSTAPSSAFVFS